MTTLIKISYGVPKNKLAIVQDYLDYVEMTDVAWQGRHFEIERDDFTCIEDDESPEAAALLRGIQEILSGEGAALEAEFLAHCEMKAKEAQEAAEEEAALAGSRTGIYHEVKGSLCGGLFEDAYGQNSAYVEELR
jgi:hypothetical protein